MERSTILETLACVALLAGCVRGGLAAERLRVIIETDAGGDPDDEQSLVRFLLYTCEWDVEGIVANRPAARDGENLNPERTGLGIVRALVRAYGECHPKLVLHDPRYPKPDRLLEVTVPGYDDTDAAVELITKALDSPDPRPVWYSDWGTDSGGAKNNLRRALDRVLEKRGRDAYARLKQRLRLSSAQNFGDHTTRLEPPFPIWVDTFRPYEGNLRWYHRFSALTATAGGFDVERDCRTGHGPLGALYPTNTTHPQKEGDSMTFVYLVPTGMNDPREPGWGSWAGRYGRRDDAANPSGRFAYYWANEKDALKGSTSRENTLGRWAADLQNDFRSRLEWCVRAFADANHAPRPVVNGVEGLDPIVLEPLAGTEARLDASASSDPDGQALSFEWLVYPEAGTFRGAVSIEPGTGARVALRVPMDAAGTAIHVLLTVRDAGSPPLARYRRVIIRPRSPEAAWRALEPSFSPPPGLEKPLASLRSPLLFDDGSPVRTPADWQRRRAEILRYWNDAMGPWPALIEHPRIQVVSSARRDGFEQRRVRVETAPAQESEGWLLVPPGTGPFPAVLVVYYEPETSVGLSKEPLRDFALELSRRGFVTLSIGTPGGDARKPEIGKAVCQPLSYHAYVAANCWQALAGMPNVDRERIGVLGHSYGGKWALFAGALWEKFAAVAVSDPGIVFDETRPNVNYWEPWYLGLEPETARKEGVPAADNPRTGAYKRLVEAGRDLHELHTLIAPRPFFVSGGSEDPPARWAALAHAVEVNRLLGRSGRVGMTNREGHSPTGASNEQIYAFFERFLDGGR